MKEMKEKLSIVRVWKEGQIYFHFMKEINKILKINI